MVDRMDWEGRGWESDLGMSLDKSENCRPKACSENSEINNCRLIPGNCLRVLNDKHMTVV